MTGASRARRAKPVAATIPAPSRSGLRDRVSDTILAAAAEVFAREGTSANMADVAATAGVARATVYRYFPRREELVKRLAEKAIVGAGTRLQEAGLTSVSAAEGVNRAVRTLLEVGDYFTVLARMRVRPDEEEYERTLLVPLRALFAQGQARMELRDDIPSEWLTNALLDLVVSVTASTPRLGRDDTVERVAALFLDGARARGEAAAQTADHNLTRRKQ
jgi:TetR/AcrR family transcriptional regulator, mexCD-oprJ operon repressor